MAGLRTRKIPYILNLILLLFSIVSLQAQGERVIDQSSPRVNSTPATKVNRGTISPTLISPPKHPLLLMMHIGKEDKGTTSSRAQQTSQVLMDPMNMFGLLNSNGISNNATGGPLDYLAAALSMTIVQVVKKMLIDTPPRTLLPRPAGVGQVCYDELMTSFEALVGEPVNTSNGDVAYTSMDWALRVFDAYGKPGAGILAGALQFTGYYDQCLATHGDVPAGTYLGKSIVKENKSFSMRYCRVQYDIGHKYPKLSTVPKHVATSWWNNGSLPPLVINWGVCVPQSCSGPDLKLLFSGGGMSQIGLPVDDVVCFDEPSMKDDVPAIITLALLGVFCALVLVCTMVDVWLCHFALGTRQIEINVEARNTKTNKSKEAYMGLAPAKRVQGSHEQEQASNGNVIHLKNVCNGHAKTESPRDAEAFKEGNRKEVMENESVAGSDMTTDNTITIKPKKTSKNTKSTGRRLVEAFSFYTNFGKLLHVKKSPDTIECLAGMRFISIVWIIIGHTFTYGAILDERDQMFDNIDHLPRLIASKAFHLIGSAQLAVDTFFVQSGFLVMSKMMSFKRIKQFSLKPCFWINVYVHRFFRLTPVYMMVMMTGTFLYDHVVHGPLKAYEFEEFHQCRTKWWSHLLYVNNFIEPEKKCMTWSWYLAVDMQLFILLPLFIIPASRSKMFGVVVVSGGIAMGMVATFIAKYDNPGAFIMMDNSFIDYWKHVYTMPWARSGAYLVGLLLGIFLPKGNGKPIMSKTLAFLVWIVVAAVGLFLVFIIHDQWRASSDHWSPELQALYEAVFRPAWAVCVAWVIYACCTGLGGFANTILSWNAFVPLSRLGYCMYLLHPVVITFVLYSRRTTIYMDPAHLSIIYNFFGNLALTILLSVVFSMTFEAPVLTLEKIFSGKTRSEGKREDVAGEDGEDRGNKNGVNNKRIKK